ncbi:26S proteasome non-ATPase regulatory subunit 6, partial [Coemansia sp. RSA 1285]
MSDGAVFAKKPELALAQHRFTLLNGTSEQKSAALQKILEGIKADKMIGFYNRLVAEGLLQQDAKLAKELEQASAKELAELDKNIEVAKEEHGDLEQNES